ncbi:MAG TPA: DUF721 domain-containing protein [Armatimonadota bacterium]|nr:DUF721 domain-containing protein [Armatimonadota bacterium]
MRRSFETLGYVLESVLTGLEMGSRTREYLALILWADIVGEQVARITAVRSVRNGVLQVDVESSAWAQELQFYKPDMIGKINKYVGANAISDIHFRVGSIVKAKPKKGLERQIVRRRRGRTPDIQLTLDECREIEETASKVSEPDLREALSSTMANYRRLERWMEQEGWKRCAQCHALFRRRRGCPFCAF